MEQQIFVKCTFLLLFLFYTVSLGFPAFECCENSEGFSFRLDENGGKQKKRVFTYIKHREQRRWLLKDEQEKQNILERTSEY